MPWICGRGLTGPVDSRPLMEVVARRGDKSPISSYGRLTLRSESALERHFLLGYLLGRAEADFFRDVPTVTR